MNKASVARVRVLLKPGSSRSGVIGWSGEELVVAVHERPIENQANQALAALIADVLSVPPRSVTIASGATSRHKTLVVAGCSQDELDVRVRRIAGGPAHDPAVEGR